LVSGILWDGISDSRLGDYSSNVDFDPDLHHPIPQSFQARVRFDGSLFALGLLRDCPEFLDLVAELKCFRYAFLEVGKFALGNRLEDR
jgi:hypothetical protein